MVYQNLFDSLKYELRAKANGNGDVVSSDKTEKYTAEEIKTLLRFSRLHSVSHIVSHSLMIQYRENPNASKLGADYYKALGLCERQKFVLGEIRRIFDGAEIPYIFLKGSAIRELYPEEWMRTSSDIDVLVHKCDLDRACKALSLTGKFTIGEKGTHDIQLTFSDGVKVELHFSLYEDNRRVKIASVLNRVWDYTERKEQDRSEYILTDDMLYFYSVAHMVKHFENGGCGIRYFIDLWLLNRIPGRDDYGRKKLLLDGGILSFAKACSDLSDRWFSDTPHPELDEFSDFILSLGTFGDRKSNVLIKSGSHSGKTAYLLSRVFMPYSLLIEDYPKLEGKKFLTPVYEVKRWYDIASKRHGKALKEIKYAKNSEKNELESVRKILHMTGLDES